MEARKVYTRTGDDGTTGLFHGGRVAKDAPGPAAYGDVDEAVSALGVARARTDADSELHALLLRLQRELFVVGAELATEPVKRGRLEPGVSRVTPEMVTALEPLIDDVTTRFDPPREFVVPGENELAAALDLARTVVRRAERQAVATRDAGWLGDSQVVPVPLTFTIAAPPADRVEADLLAVPVGAERAFGPGADVVDAALDGDLGAFMEEADFDGKPEQTLAVPTRGRLGAAAALLVGVGPFDDVTGDGLRRAAAAIARRATRAPSVATTLVDLADGAGLER